MIIRNVNINCLDDFNRHKHGVYMIENLINHKKYIGSAAGKGGFIERFRHHIFDLDNQKHHSQKLLRAFLKENKDYKKFQFTILEYCEPIFCVVKEQYWINYHDAFHCGYNSTPIAGSLLNSKRTEQQKRKMSLAKQKISEIIINNILNDYNETDLTYSELALKYNTSCTIISWIINNPNYYPHIKKRMNFINERYKYVFVSPNNIIYKCNDVTKFSKEHNLSRASIVQVLTKKLKKLEHKGWLIFYKNDFSVEKIEKLRKQNQGKMHKITNGTIEYSFSNVPKFCREFKFNETPIYHLIKGQINNYKGFKLI